MKEDIVFLLAMIYLKVCLLQKERWNYQNDKSEN